MITFLHLKRELQGNKNKIAASIATCAFQIYLYQEVDEGHLTHVMLLFVIADSTYLMIVVQVTGCS